MFFVLKNAKNDWYGFKNERKAAENGNEGSSKPPKWVLGAVKPPS